MGKSISNSRWIRASSRSRAGVLRDHHQLCEIAVVQPLVQRQHETRRALADVVEHMGDILVLPQQGFEPDRLGARGIDGRAFRQPHFDQDFQPVGLREELFLDPLHCDESDDQRRHRQRNHAAPMDEAPVHHGAETPVERREIRRIFVCHVASWFQQDVPQVRRHHDRHQPGGQQRDRRHRENGEGVFADHRLGQRDRQECGGGQQGTGQHGKRGRMEGVGGRFEAVPAGLQLVRHHFHCDDGVVHQQAESDDERPGGDTMQVDVEQPHRGEGDRQHHRDGQRHHQAGTPLERKEGHRQHDGDGFEETLHEEPDRVADDAGLVVDPLDLHAHRQRLLQVLHGGRHGTSHRHHVTAVGQRHPEQHCRLALRTDFGGGRIFVAPRHAGDISQPDAARADPDDRFAHALDVGIGPRYTQRDRQGLVFDPPIRHHAVLLLHGLHDLLRREAEGGELLRRNLDVDFSGTMPNSSTLPTLGRRRTSRCASSATRRRSDRLKPSPVKA